MTSIIPSLKERLAAHAPAVVEDPALIWAAVAIILVPDPDALLLIRRAERTGDPWSGHMALPGGRRSATDPALLDTAIRETAEEVGAHLTPSDCIGTLDDVAPRTPVLPPIAVRPYVFALKSIPPLTPNAEVASTHWTPLTELRTTGAYRQVDLIVHGASRSVPAYHLENAIVWGMTERILTSLLPLMQ